MNNITVSIPLEVKPRWVRTFEPTGRGQIIMRRFFAGEPRGTISYAVDAQPLGLTAEERAEWDIAVDLERNA